MKEYTLYEEDGSPVKVTVYEPGDAPGLTITVVDGLTCPRCGAGELKPGTEDLPFYDYKNPDAPHKIFQLRGFKTEDEYGWWSECLPCAEKYGNGWFCGEVLESDLIARGERG